ncbi:hypothetical protein P22_0755 [Propionispora sp. 2/2-37]|uniref:flagellar protein FlaG n=1 Tax=Propionispora sp. 2/2-37 TaxID=1677858 RepID=UPI0006BB9833|nr:flagellar protein FlaG [Propionispora sp. 2/2-37]CUH94689.1 hypothetical protein P22_0755 [Propionispora sp. 2/2-37]
MDINSITSLSPLSSMPPSLSNYYSSGQNITAVATGVDFEAGQEASPKQKQEIDEQKAEKLNNILNNFLESINTKLRFKLHEESDQFMVEVVDIESGKVLKECPPEEYLDMIGKIKNYIGAILDETA